MQFEFIIPIKGEKMFTVEAESLEEAIHKMINEDVEGKWTDMDFDLDVHEVMEDFLRSQYD